MNQLDHDTLAHWALVAALLLVSAAIGVAGLVLAPRVTIALLGAGLVLGVATGVAMHRYGARRWWL